MSDIYLYDDVHVLRNKLDIKDEKTLDMIEAEQSRQNMMLLYKKELPEHSKPERIIAIDKMPFLTSGKIDSHFGKTCGGGNT